MLLIDSPLNGNIDIHGFGKGDKDVLPLIHGVIDHDLARLLYQVRYKPSHEFNQLISSHVQIIMDPLDGQNLIQTSLIL